MGNPLSGEIAKIVQSPRCAADEIEGIRKIAWGRPCRDILVRPQKVEVAAACPVQALDCTGFVIRDHVEHGLAMGQVGHRRNLILRRTRTRRARFFEFSQFKQRSNQRVPHIRGHDAARGFIGQVADFPIGPDAVKDDDRGRNEAKAKAR